MDNNFKAKSIIFIIFTLAATLVFYLANSLLDSRVNDFITKILTNIRNTKGSSEVVLVEIDKKSLSQRSWPWSRDLFTDIFDYLEKEAGAKCIVFDNLIIYPDSYYEEEDKIFNNSLKTYNTLINSYILLNSANTANVLPEQYTDLFVKKTNVDIIDKRVNTTLPTYKAIINLPKDFLFNSKYLASSIIPEDNDEIVREYMPVVKYKDKILPSLSLSAYAMYSGNKTFYLYDNFLCSKEDCSTLKIPIKEKKGRDYIGNNVYGIYSTIKWYKPVDKFNTHKSYSAIDVLLSYYASKEGKTPKIHKKAFKNKIVILGLNADNDVWERLSETPILKRLADVDVHATAINNMIDNKYYTHCNIIHILIITAIFSILLLRGFKKLKNNILFALILSIIYFIYYIYMQLTYVIVPPVSPIAVIMSIPLLRKVYNITTTDKNSELIKRAMGKYVSKDVMKKVISNLDKLKLGGIRTDVTILFVDIRNFTQISEQLSPQSVSSILNEYFSVIEPIIAKYNGIVNKYMGDGLLAIFGEPIKTDNHALNSVKCGIEIINAVTILKEKFIKENKPKIDIGIAINTGEVFIGNIGTEERLEYTVIGDNVNLAYRIESLNQVLKTQFLISEYTYEYVKDCVEVVKLSQMNIKGKSKPIDIYEVLRYTNNE
jgi:adenylate cyclase